MEAANQLDREARDAADGDRDALAALLRSLQDTLFRVCLTRLGNADVARDATQETALRIVRGIATFRRESSVRTWAIGIAINVCRESSRPDRTDRVGPTWLDAQPGREAEPAAAAATVESVQAVRRLVRELPSRQAEAVTLRHLEGLSVADTAAAMGCSEGTVKAAVWQGLKRLHTQLGEAS